MKASEILRSNVLEILFENRNKQYGAYTLRKFYNNRLGMAMGIMLSSILLIVLLVRFTSGNSTQNDVFSSDRGVIINTVDLPQPKTSETTRSAQKAKAATKKLTNQIQIVKDIKASDFPTTTDLLNTQIGTSTIHSDPGPITSEPYTGPVTAAPQPTPEPATANFIPTESKPSFPGGSKAWAEFLSNNLQPFSDLQAGEQKRVLVRFWVGLDGTVTRFEIIQSGGEAFDKEVLRVLKKMPKWTPAMQNGHAVATSFQQPVIFQSMEE